MHTLNVVCCNVPCLLRSSWIVWRMKCVIWNASELGRLCHVCPCCLQAHATKVVCNMRSEELSKYQGLVAIGGDGRYCVYFINFYNSRACAEVLS